MTVMDAQEPAARSLRRELVSDELIDQLLERSDSAGVALTGAGGFLPELVKAILERGLSVELDDHLGYVKGDPSGRAVPNARNGSTPKTLATEVGTVLIDTPRDRKGSFEPRLVPKHARRLDGLESMIVSLYAGGMTDREIEHHLVSTLGVEMSRETISKITDAVLEEVAAWQTRPLDAFYPVLFLDALVIKIKENNQIRNKAAHVAVGIDIDGEKHVLGIWIQQTEGAKFWASVCAELANRGVQDVLIACVDGLSGFSEAIEATWHATIVQTCVVHLIRSSMRFVSYGDRKAVAAGLRSVYTAVNDADAADALEAFAGSVLGRKYPATVAAWQAAWTRFIPFLAFPPEVRRVIYTTNTIESLNYQLRKTIKTRGHFPNDTAAVKLLWLSIRNIEDKRARARASASKKERDRGDAKILIEGARTDGWKAALSSLVLAYPERFTNYIN